MPAMFYCLALQVFPLELMAGGYCAKNKVTLFLNVLHVAVWISVFI